MDDILSNVEFFVVVNIMRWQKTSGLANQSSPTLTTPKCINNQKIIFVTSKRIDPLNDEQLSCSQKAVNAATEGHDYEAQLWGVL